MPNPATFKKMAYANLVIEKASQLTDIPMDFIKSKSRKKERALARHSISYALKVGMGLPHDDIVKALGRSNHTTSLHSCQLVTGQMVAAKRSEDMDYMVEIAKKLVYFIDNEMMTMNPCPYMKKRGLVSMMRDSGCHYMSVVGVLSY